MNVSKKIFFSAENLLGAKSSDVLQNKELPESINSLDLNGNASYSVCVIQLTNNERKIKSLTVTLAENYSSTRKNSNPLSQFLFFGLGSADLNSIQNIDENIFVDSKFKFNGVEFNDYRDLSGFKLNASNVSNSPENIISFDSLYDFSTDKKYFYFLPKYTVGTPSILDKLKRFYWSSFYEDFHIQKDIQIPDEFKYIAIFPYATLPVVPSKTTTATASIYTSYFLNMEIGE